MNAAIQFPGLNNAWTMPIKTRIDMLATGIKTPVGIKIAGPDLAELERVAAEVEAVVKTVPGTAQRLCRAHHGRQLHRVQHRPRCHRPLRPQRRRRPGRAGSRPGRHAADDDGRGPGALRGEPPLQPRFPREPRRVARDRRPHAHRARRSRSANWRKSRPFAPPWASRARRPCPMPGSTWTSRASTSAPTSRWPCAPSTRPSPRARSSCPPATTSSGAANTRYMLQAKQRLMIVVPLTLLIIILIIYLNTRSAIKTAIVMLAVPFSLVGAIGILALLHYNLSVAVWVGIIALAGLDAETGVVMLLVPRPGLRGLEETRPHAQRRRPARRHLSRRRQARPPQSHDRLRHHRRPGAHSLEPRRRRRRDEAHRHPMIGGVVTSTIMELLVYPAIFLPLALPAATWSRQIAAIDGSQKQSRFGTA